MKFTNKHKAMCITFLLAGTVVFMLFSFHIQKKQKSIAESYYEIISEETNTTEADKIKLEAEDATKAETNKAFNENQKANRFANAYKRIEAPEDYIPPDLSDKSAITKPITTAPSQINKQEADSYEKVNALLKKQQEGKTNNARSTVSFSLLNRKHIFLPTPIYLCEKGGKVVVNITVTALGEVIEATYNNASTSTDGCMVEHAIAYAKKARFNVGSKAQQIGTISFNFKAKN